MDPTLTYARVRFEPPWLPPEAESLSWFNSAAQGHTGARKNGMEATKKRQINEKLIRDDLAEWPDYPFPTGSLGLRLAPVFANIDAVVDFTQRRGGYLGRSELRDFTAAVSGSFALEGLAYVYYRFPDAVTLLLADSDNPAAIFKGARGYGSLPAWLPPLSTEPSHYSTEEAIVRRFPDPINLLVCDLSFSLHNIDRLLQTDGYLICIVPRQIDSIANEFIIDIAARFSSWVLFYPFAFLGERAVVCATGVHPPSGVDQDAVRSYIATVTSGFEKAEPHVWSDRNFYDHRRSSIAWNIS